MLEYIGKKFVASRFTSIKANDRNKRYFSTANYSPIHGHTTSGAHRKPWIPRKVELLPGWTITVLVATDRNPDKRHLARKLQKLHVSFQDAA